jgi:hypothetical protein
MNLFESNLQSDNIIDNSTYQVRVKSQPRVDREVYKPPPGKVKVITKKRPLWTLRKSVFRDFTVETEELNQSCFEKDWGNGKYDTMIKNDEDRQKTKEYLSSIYKKIRVTFRHLSSTSSVIFSS